jgi:DNA-binding NarL/FixJ family response regulator/signal transduction histidine kinase
VEVSAYPTSDAQHRVTGVIAEIRDVTDDRQAERQLAHYDKQLRRINTILSDLATAQDFSSALAGAADALQEIITFDAYALYLPAEVTEQIDPSRGASRLEDMDGLDATDGLLGDIVRHAVSQHVAPFTGDLANLADEAAQHRLFAHGLRSAMIVPVPALDGALGFFSREDHVYNERDLLLATQFTQFIRLIHEHQKAIHDTQLSTKRDERDRLARELHDVLAQTITSVVLQLEAVMQGLPEHDSMRASLELARTSARSAVAETRRVVWNLRSSSVNLEEPHSVVQEEATKLVRRLGIRPEIISTGEKRLLAPEVGAVVQRLTRVALDNIWSHSEAKNVRILLDFGLQAFTLLIEDDGKGFDPEDVDLLSAGRVGLAGVAERARVIGGALRIESAANQGTRVWAIVPYSPGVPVPRARAAVESVVSPALATPGTVRRIRVVLIDDHSMVREGLEHMLSDQPDLQVVGAAANGSDGLRIINELQPDVVLCDLQLPDISGVEVISRVRTLFPEIRCVIVTTYDHDDFIYEGIKSGAKGYVLKDVSSAELSDAVRAAFRNESLLQPVVAGKLLERFGEMARQGDMVEPLTDREIGVLRALATGSRNKEIALQLSLSESTIKTHLASIFGKLGVTTRTEAVTRGREIGLIPL